MHRHSVKGRFASLVAIGSLIGLVSGSVAIATPASAATKIGHGAGAYGSSIQLGSVFSSGRSALATLGCTNAGGIVRSNSAVSVGLLTAGSVGTINDQVSTTHPSTTASSQVQSVSLFSNLIAADAVTVTATTTTDDGDFTTSGAMTAANLSINGTPMSAPAPNTVVPLPGVGSVTINEQIPNVKAETASMDVNALHVHIAVADAFGFPVGTDIIIGHTKAAIDITPTQILAGHAFGTQVQGIGAASGKTALIHLPCDGTNGKVHSNTTASTNVPGVLSTGTEKSTSTGVASKSFATGTTTDSIQNTVLLNLVTVDSIKAQANASLVAGEKTFTDTGSSFGNIAVLGIPTLPDPVPPNSQYDIPGVGTLYLHRIIEKGSHIEVRMIELVLSVPVGPLGVGTDIRIGVAAAGVR